MRALEHSSSDSPLASVPPQCEQIAACIASSHRIATRVRSACENAITLLSRLCIFAAIAFENMGFPSPNMHKHVINVVPVRSVEHSNFSIKDAAGLTLWPQILTAVFLCVMHLELVLKISFHR